MPEKEILRPYKRLRKLTPKERKYVKGVVSGKTKKQAALEAGFKQPPTSDEVERAIVRVMDKAGLSDCKLVAQLKRYVFKAKQEDNALKALRMAFELKDHFPANRKTPQFAQQVNIYQGVDNAVLAERIRKLLERVGEEKGENRPILPDEGNSGV